MRRSVGPMLPMEEFDAPENMRQRYELLRDADAPAQSAIDLAQRPAPRIVDRNAGNSIHAELCIPEDAPFFCEHFPRKPVFPATLLLDVTAGLAVELGREALAKSNPAALRVGVLRDIKIGAFAPPGSVLTVGAQLLSAAAGGAQVALFAKANGKRIGRARVDVLARENDA